MADSAAPTGSTAPSESQGKETAGVNQQSTQQTSQQVQQQSTVQSQAGKEPAIQAQEALKQVGQVLNMAGDALTKKSAEPQAPTTTAERLWGALAYIPMVALISLLMKPTSAFVKLHARQGLMLFIVFFLTLFLYIIFPPLGPLLAMLIQLALFVVGIYSIYMAFSGNWWKIPFVNQIAEQLPVEIFTKVTTEAITGQPAAEVPPATETPQPQTTRPAESPQAPQQVAEPAKSTATPPAQVPKS